MTAAGSVVAIAGGVTFAVVVAWLHVRRRDLDARTTGISHYAAGGAKYISYLLAGTVACFFLGLAGVPGLFAIRGWLQRGCFAAVVTWLVIVGWQFWQLDKRHAGDAGLDV